MVSIFDQKSAPSFLKKYLDSLPKRGWGVSRQLAKHLNVNTSLISLILTGRQTLSLEQAYGITRYFGWTSIESKYFLLMVQHERAGTVDLKKFYAAEMLAVKKEALKLSERLENYQGLTEEQRTTFYSSAIYSSIRLFCSLNEEGKTLGDISSKFPLPLSQLRPILDFLLNSGLLKMTGERFQFGHQHTHVEQGSPHLLKHHTNWRLQSIQKVERLSEDEIVFTGPMSMSYADYMKIREEIIELIKRTVETMKASPAEMVVCLNIDWFKVLNNN